jgi:hypothetical protein
MCGHGVFFAACWTVPPTVRGVTMEYTVCAFCGVATRQAHDSQEACIAALQTEIEKTRQLLAAVDPSPPEKPVPTAERQDIQTT